MTLSAEARQDGRWRTALHEAGHVVASVVLNGGQRGCLLAGAVAFDEGGGLAFPSPTLPKDDEAIMVAAGRLAEDLMQLFPPPGEAPPPDVLASTLGDGAEGVKADAAKAVPDEVAVAQHCIEGVEARPWLWYRRWHEIQLEAAVLVERNAARIVQLARILYSEGFAGSAATRKVFDEESGTAIEERNGHESQEHPPEDA